MDDHGDLKPSWVDDIPATLRDLHNSLESHYDSILNNSLANSDSEYESEFSMNITDDDEDGNDQEEENSETFNSDVEIENDSLVASIKTSCADAFVSFSSDNFSEDSAVFENDNNTNDEVRSDPQQFNFEVAQI